MKTNLRLIGGQKIDSPDNTFTRPTTLRVREAIFNILKNEVYNSNWLDLFSGTGAISCEAYNHGAKKIVAVERNKKNSEICLKNILSLQDTENRKNDINVICNDVLIWTRPNFDRKSFTKTLNLDELKFDIIYLDPPYGVDYHELVLKQIFYCGLVRTKSIVICEHSSGLNMKKSDLWRIIDVRDYGQSRLTFLIYV